MSNEPSKNESSKNEHSSWLDQTWFAFVMLAIIAAVVVALWLKVPQHLGEGLTEPTDKGTFGDSFGSVNALFTGLAFAGLVFSILLQQRQIRLQRADFLSQLQEMKDSRSTVIEQNKLMTAQNVLMTAQTALGVLRLELHAMELEAQVDELEIRRMGNRQDSVPINLLAGMRSRVDALRVKIQHAKKVIGTTDFEAM